MFLLGDKVRYVGPKYTSAVGTVRNSYVFGDIRFYTVQFSKHVSSEIPEYHMREATLSEVWLKSRLDLRDKLATCWSWLVAFFRRPDVCMAPDYWRPIPAKGKRKCSTIILLLWLAWHRYMASLRGMFN